MSFYVFKVSLFPLYDNAKGVSFHFGLTKLVILHHLVVDTVGGKEAEGV